MSPKYGLIWRISPPVAENGLKSAYLALLGIIVGINVGYRIEMN